MKRDQPSPPLSSAIFEGGDKIEKKKREEKEREQWLQVRVGEKGRDEDADKRGVRFAWRHHVVHITRATPTPTPTAAMRRCRHFNWKRRLGSRYLLALVSPSSLFLRRADTSFLRSSIRGLLMNVNVV